MSTKVYDGAAWQVAQPKVWQGSFWVNAVMRTYDGALWVPGDIPPGALFEDDFNRADAGTWGPKWDYSTSGTGVEAIESNRGVIGVASGGNDTYAAQIAAGLVLPTTFQILTLLQTAGGTGNAWTYIMWNSTGDFTGSAGRPTDAWYLRRDSMSSKNEYFFYRRIGNNEVQIENLGSVGSAQSNQWVRIVMDAANHIQVYIWTDGSSEPGSPQINYTEPGALPGGNQLQLNVRKYNTASPVPEGFFDSIIVEEI